MKQLSALDTLTEVAKAREGPERRVRLASIRVSPAGYWAVASVLTFTSVLLVRFENNISALVALALAWLITPALAFFDRIAFDGQFLSRQGPVPLMFRWLSGRSQQLSAADFEIVETNAVRTLRRAGRVRYRYRTQVIGKGTEFTFSSGGRNYRRMVHLLLPLVHDDKLDLRTRELRDFLSDPGDLQQDVESLNLASAEVLEDVAQHFKISKTKELDEVGTGGDRLTAVLELERAKQLRQLANRLRIAGRLREAGEAFRRALNITPKDGWLIYDFARLLRSQASALGDARLLSRARAAFRLSSVRAGNDSKLFSQIGESLLECGEPERAEKSFLRAIDLEAKNFRARLGLADTALRNGKLAHVIHQYRDAAEAAIDKATLIHARGEADYYALLNDDDDYLAAELRRMSWLQHFTRIRKLAAQVTNASILIALLGPYIDTALAGIGWSLASSSLVAWLSSLLAIQLFSNRRKPRPAH